MISKKGGPYSKNSWLRGRKLSDLLKDVQGYVLSREVNQNDSRGGRYGLYN